MRNDLCQLHGCVVTELRIGKKPVSLHAYIDPLAKHPVKFEDFCTDLILFLSNINDLNSACSVITGDFNARSPEW